VTSTRLREPATGARLLDDILVTGRTEKLAGYFNGDKHIKHNPQIADNLSDLDSALRSMAAQGIRMKYERVHKVLGEGNFVLVVSEGACGGKQTSFYDLLRVESGKIAEHWDAIEPFLPTSSGRMLMASSVLTRKAPKAERKTA
jgi:predicted SnoaL-like aldol condensation-catalyzing enzyme